MMSGFGEDLYTEILVRLPAKSLIRFKCVQKFWNDLFKTPTFVRRQMHTHVLQTHLMVFRQFRFNDHCLMVFPRCRFNDPTSTPTHVPTKSLFPNPDNNNNNNNSPITTRILLYGHCNGVFCLHEIPDRLIMWNPTTREVHAIPPPPLPYHPNQSVISLFGFGAADHPNSTNDLKVVNLHVDFDTSSISTAQIYSVCTKSWTIIHGPILPSGSGTLVRRNRPSKCNTLVKGVYHWMASYPVDDDAKNILCFDFRNNRLSILRGPVSCVAAIDVRWDGIAEINGSLAYVMEHRNRLEIWVMGQREWAKKYSIGPSLPSRVHGIWKDGAEVLGSDGFMVGKPLTSYDHDGNSVRQFQVTLTPYDLWVHEYVPSIVPLTM